MKRGITALAAAGLLAMLASPVLAGTIKVPNDYDTIQEAVDNADDGDTILVSKGVYREQVTVTGKNNLRFIGKKAIWTGNVDGDQDAALTVDGDGILVQGFIFLHGDGQVHITGDDAVVTKCTSEGGNYEDRNYSFVRIDGNGARVEKNKIRDAAEPAIDVNGNGAIVSKNQFGYMRDMGVTVAGHDCVVEKNKFTTCNVMAINVEGHRARVVSNTITYSRVMAIKVEGERVHIEKNKITYGGGVAGISAGWEGDAGGSIVGNKIKAVTGVGIRLEDDHDDDELNLLVDLSTDPPTDDLISGNKIDFPGKDGIQCERDNTTISGNKIKYAGSRGIYIYEGDNCTVDGNQVTGSGNGTLAGIEVHTDGNTITNNKVLKHAGDGFHIDGNNNTLRDLLASLCSEDGFDLESDGNNNSLTRCTATKCGAEGLDNSADTTDVSASTFTGNRIDVANDGTFANLAAKFSTGGETTDPEVDGDDDQRDDRW